MPNRILRDSIRTSRSLACLTAEEERCFYRLLSAADDFGRFDGRPEVIKGNCFPLLNVSVNDVDQWLTSLAAPDVDIIRRYEVEGKPYLVFVHWEDYQQVRSRTSKYPPPPVGIGRQEDAYPLEADIEDLVSAQLAVLKQFGGADIMALERQVRLENSYVDLLITTINKRYAVEIKRTKLSNAAIKQVKSYMALINGEAILIGAGMTPSFDLEDCRNNKITVLIYNEELELTLINPTPLIPSCYILGFDRISQDNPLTPLAPVVVVEDGTGDGTEDGVVVVVVDGVGEAETTTTTKSLFLQNLETAFEETIGPPRGVVQTEMLELAANMPNAPPEWAQEAVAEAARAGEKSLNWRYVKAILRAWQNDPQGRNNRRNGHNSQTELGPREKQRLRELAAAREPPDEPE